MSAPYGVRSSKTGTGPFAFTGLSITVNSFTPSRIGIIAVDFLYLMELSIWVSPLVIMQEMKRAERIIFFIAG
jgi:hypothetical protein